MSRLVRLDDLLGNTEPHASFHDASLEFIQIDYRLKALTAEFDICVGDPDADDNATRERRRKGKLHVSELILWSIEPPSDINAMTLGYLWLTDDGLLEDAPTQTGKRLAQEVQAEDLGWYLYFSDLNAFAYCVAKVARFEWD